MPECESCGTEQSHLCPECGGCGVCCGCGDEEEEEDEESDRWHPSELGEEE